MQRIPNAATANFCDPQCRRELMAQYGDSKMPFYGANEEGENVLVSIAKDSIVTRTFQRNGFVRVNYYDANGNAEGESFEGRWRDASFDAPQPKEKEPSISFDFGISSRHSTPYYTAVKFVDLDSVAHCQAIRYVFSMKNTLQGLVWDKLDHHDYPVSNVALRCQFNAMIQHLDKAWTQEGTNRPDAKSFIHWIDQNCEHIMADLNGSFTFALTDIAVFYLHFNLEVAKNGELIQATVQVDVFNRLYITENPIGAALVPACVAEYPKMKDQQKTLAFAATVCSEVLSNMGDGPGIQVRLREAIKTLNKLSGKE